MVVTHDLHLAERIADRVAFLHQGRFRFLGDWEEAQNTEDELFASFLAGQEEARDVA